MSKISLTKWNFNETDTQYVVVREARDGTVVRALASHQCGRGSNLGVDTICGLSLLSVLSFAPRGFSSGTLVFPSPQKPTFPNSNSIRNRVDEEPLCGCATSKSLSLLLLLERSYGWCNHTYCIVACCFSLKGLLVV